MPDNFDAAGRRCRSVFRKRAAGIDQLLDEMAAIASAAGSLAQDGSALMNSPDWTLSLSQKLDAVFGDDEAVKCALAANLSYFHDDPATLWWIHFAVAQGSYLQSGGRFVQGGSQRLSSALARAIRAAGGEVLLRRVATGIALDAQGRASAVTHTAKDGSDSRTVECGRVVGNAAPGALAPLMPQAAADRLQASYAKQRAVDFAVRHDARPGQAAARIRGIGLFHAIAAAPAAAACPTIPQGAAADGRRTGRADAADVAGRFHRDQFRDPLAAPCALGLRTRFAVELGRFGHGRLPRKARALAGRDRPLSGFALSRPCRRRGGVVVQHRIVGPAVSQCA